MTDKPEPASDPEADDATTSSLPPGKNDKTIALVVYGLYLAGFFTAVTAIIGLVIAYVKRDETSELVRGHLNNQIKIFWIGLVSLIVGSALTLVFIGWLVLLAWAIWTLYVCVKGGLRLMEDKPV